MHALFGITFLFMGGITVLWAMDLPNKESADRYGLDDWFKLTMVSGILWLASGCTLALHSHAGETHYHGEGTGHSVVVDHPDVNPSPDSTGTPKVKDEADVIIEGLMGPHAR